MGKQKGIFTFSGTMDGMTEVDSKTYGSHLRAARGTHKPAVLNDGFKASGKVLEAANPIAKAIKDPLDPYRVGLELHSNMWNRLVSVVKNQLHKNGFLDFEALDEFQFHKRFRFGSLVHAQVEVSVPTDEPVLKLKVLSHCGLKLTSKNRADSYEQTAIVMFLDEAYRSQVSSQSIILPLTPIEPREHSTEWPIPPDMKAALIILKCDYWVGDKSAGLPSRKGMQVVRVVKRGDDGVWTFNKRKYE